MMYNWYRKESPLSSLIGMAGGIGRNLIRSSLGPSATGGDEIIDTPTHWIHVFTSPGTFSNSRSLDVDYLMVGGGGYGGANLGGGGGGGAFIYKTAATLSVDDYSITIGQGGTVGTAWPSYNKPTPGTPTTFNALTASGGGGGSGAYPGPAPWQNGSNGASGGGGGGEHTAHAKGYATADPYPGVFGDSPNNGWGHDGGNGFAPWNFCGGGGGGASVVGDTGTAPSGGPGGDGLPVTWMPPSYGTPGPQPGRWFGGGGAGRSYGPGYGVHGIPGHGAGTPGSLSGGGDNTGGGGGGRLLDGTGTASSTGYAGIVAIRYSK
jgi:hypothetical protein